MMVDRAMLYKTMRRELRRQRGTMAEKYRHLRLALAATW